MTIRPSYPSSRRVSAALAPAKPAPTMTNVLFCVVTSHSLLSAPGTPGGFERRPGRARAAPTSRSWRQASGCPATPCTCAPPRERRRRLRLQLLLQPVGDLGRQPLLYVVDVRFERNEKVACALDGRNVVHATDVLRVRQELERTHVVGYGHDSSASGSAAVLRV